MSFHLRQGHSAGSELHRVVDRQLGAAIERLENASANARRDAIHEARKHVKKVRAVLHVLHPATATRLTTAARRLRRVNRQLGLFADAWAVLDTLEQLRQQPPQQAGGSLDIDAVRHFLIERARRMEIQIEAGRLQERMIHLLGRERLDVKTWPGKATDDQVIRGVAKAHSRAAAAMRAAFTHPSAGTFHTWRQRVKTEWYLLRLVAGRCGERVDPDLRRLKALDGRLGDLHNVSTLMQVVVADLPGPRGSTVEVLQALRAYQRTLRRDARAMRHVYSERPTHLAARLHAAWDNEADTSHSKGRRAAAGTRPGAAVRVGPWPHVA